MHWHALGELLLLLCCWFIFQFYSAAAGGVCVFIFILSMFILASASQTVTGTVKLGSPCPHLQLPRPVPTAPGRMPLIPRWT